MATTKLKQLGLTLIEIMVVIVIIAILASIVVPKIMSRPEQAKKVKVKQDIISIENSLDLYKLDNGYYPSQDQGIQALITRPTTDPLAGNWNPGGYLKKLPLDPWGHPYHYKNPGEHGEIDIFTWGANNAPEGINMNATKGNWNEKTQ
jgi:general secretion pathway protein G